MAERKKREGTTMVTKFSIVMALVLIMAGCASKDIVRVPVEIKIPTPIAIIPPPPEAFETPSLPIHGLTKDSTTEEVTKAYVISIKILQEWGKTLQKYLEGYKNDPVE